VREALLLSSVPARSEFKVALKIIDKPKRRPDQLDRTRFEAAVGQLFRHPNIIEVLEVIESSRFLILVLPFASNGDLLDFLNRRRRFPEADAARAILQICHALEYAHSNHVIHHDVKLVLI
jgi:serine/threonine protein kinase